MKEGVGVLQLHGTLKFVVFRSFARKEGTVHEVVEYLKVLGIGYSLVLDYSLVHEYFDILGIKYSLVLEYCKSLGNM